MEDTLKQSRAEGTLTGSGSTTGQAGAVALNRPGTQNSGPVVS